MTSRTLCSGFVLPLFVGLALAACGGSGEKTPASQATDTSHAIHAAAESAAAAPAAQAAAPADYLVCQTCHQANGEGLPNAFPPLAGSAIVNGPVGPHIAIVLKGLTGPVTVKGATYNGMMAPWESLTDEQIVGAINYERASWGNTGTPVTAADVARIREAVKGRTTPWTIAELEKASLK
ncbi:MAG TPA: cytochrome c [Gemmatimonadales bacterium]|nr:cytochrome c [Gemmatimonadales bacterium]